MKKVFAQILPSDFQLVNSATFDEILRSFHVRILSLAIMTKLKNMVNLFGEL